MEDIPAICYYDDLFIHSIVSSGIMNDVAV